jgi:hypothetical protein
LSRFWEKPYGPKFAVGIEDTFIPQTGPGRRETPLVEAFRNLAERRGP